MNLKIALIANCPVSHKSMGGGDKTFIELAKVWQKLGAELTVFGPPESESVCRVGGLNTKFVETSKHEAGVLGTKKAYLLRIVSALFDNREFGDFDTIYSASEALPDVALSIKVKLQNPKAVWVVGFFLRARNPFFGEVPLSLASILQFIQQQLSLVVMGLYKVSGVMVAGKPDEKYVRGLGFKSVLKIGGGVDLGFIKNVPTQEKLYDACFVGRISPQKGVDDLLEVWCNVVKVKPDAKLAFVGWGHKGAAERFHSEIERLKLLQNVIFIGFADGVEKYKVFKSSRVTLFPSKYESFGIVLLESLAAGVPVVAYELDVLKDNFTQGVVYVPFSNIEGMTQAVIGLLSSEEELIRLGLEGKELACRFDWEPIGKSALDFIGRL